MSWRPSKSQFYAYGLSAACCTAESRQLTGITVGSPGMFELIGHGLDDGAVGRFRAEGNPATLPAGLSVTSLYTVVTNGGDLFSVTLNSSPVAIADDGEGVITFIQDLGPTLDMLLDGNVSYLEANAKAYKPPWTTAPLWAVKCVCELTAYDFARVLRNSKPGYSLDELKKVYDQAQTFVARLATGEPTADTVEDATPTVNEAAAVSWQDHDIDGRGWWPSSGSMAIQ